MKAAIKIPLTKEERRKVARIARHVWPNYEHDSGEDFRHTVEAILRRAGVIGKRRTQRPKKWAPKGFVEVDYVQWQRCAVTHYEDFRFSDKKGCKLMTLGEWQHCPLKTWETRFWLRRGAK